MTTNSPTSNSSAPTPDVHSTAFELLHQGVQRWIWKQGWHTLRPIQEQAVRPILEGTHDVMLAAPTAGGKTEAAFLPIVSCLASANEPRLCVCISPLKALINDQYDRLRELGVAAGVPVHRWHGDVRQQPKDAFIQEPQGLLLITPESIEAFLVRRGSQAARLLGRLNYIVVDELHAFVGSDRGKQLQSLMHRLDLLNRNRTPRVALSATFGDMQLAAEFLRPGHSSATIRIEGQDGGQELRLMLRGYRVPPPTTDLNHDETSSGSAHDIARHLFKVLRGQDNLVFANSRQRVESFADILRRLSEQAAVPNEFLPHHGNLAKALREDAEKQLKSQARPVTLVATTTLEMGIDVGSVQSIAQVGCPPSVSAMRQRLGRSGRQDNAPAILRIYTTEHDGLQRPAPHDLLRAQTTQAIAMVQLMLDGWLEPPQTGLHLSTLVQQLLSLVAQHGGVRAAEAWSVLCGKHLFMLNSPAQFATLLRGLGAKDLISQTSDGLLVLGIRGEELVDHYDFYAAFFSPAEFQILFEGTILGALPLTWATYPGGHLIFAGQRWEVLAVDDQAKTIQVKRSPGGQPPCFDGGGLLVHDEVRRQMRRVYCQEALPGFANAEAQALLKEGRRYFHASGLERRTLIGDSNTCHLFPWVGDRTMNTLCALFNTAGLAAMNEGIGLRFAATTANVKRAAQELLAIGPPQAESLATTVQNKHIGKYDHLLPEELLNANYASTHFDVDSAIAVLENCIQE